LQRPPPAHQRRQVEREAAVVIVHVVILNRAGHLAAPSVTGASSPALSRDHTRGRSRLAEITLRISFASSGQPRRRRALISSPAFSFTSPAEVVAGKARANLAALAEGWPPLDASALPEASSLP
jgi:hypothetical protein